MHVSYPQFPLTVISQSRPVGSRHPSVPPTAKAMAGPLFSPSAALNPFRSLCLIAPRLFTLTPSFDLDIIHNTTQHTRTGQERMLCSGSTRFDHSFPHSPLPYLPRHDSSAPHFLFLSFVPRDRKNPLRFGPLPPSLSLTALSSFDFYTTTPASRYASYDI